MDRNAQKVLAAVLAVAIVQWLWGWEDRRKAEKRDHPERFSGPPIAGEG